MAVAMPGSCLPIVSFARRKKDQRPTKECKTWVLVDGGEAAGVKKKKTSRGSKGKKYRKTGNQMDVERRQSDRGDQGGASGGGGLSQSGGS